MNALTPERHEELKARIERLKRANAEPAQHRSEISGLTIDPKRQDPGQNSFVKVLGLKPQWMIPKRHYRNA